MIIRLHALDEDGCPVRYTGEYLKGPSALAIIERRLLTPFNTDNSPRDFMERVLKLSGLGNVVLPKDDAEAADVFMQAQEKSGYIEICKGIPEEYEK